MKPLFLLLFTAFYAITGIAQEPHQKNALSIEELMQKNDPKAYRAMTTKTNFMVVSNYNSGKRWRYFEGDLLRFKTKEGKYYEEDIAFIEDSTFSIYKYNTVERKMEEFTFALSDVSSVYKRKRGGVIQTGLLSMAPFIPMALLDWGVYNNNPLKNRDFLWITPIVGIGNVLIFKHKNLFNKQKLGNNKDLRIIKPL